MALTLKPGDEVIVVMNWSAPEEVRTGKLLSTDGDACTVGFGGHSTKFYSHAVLPAALKDRALQIATERRRLQSAYEDSMSLVYELINSWKRGELP